MAQKFVEVLGLTNVFNPASSTALDTTTLKPEVASKANSNSILFMTAIAADEQYGYPADTKYIWTRGKIYNANDTVSNDEKVKLTEGIENEKFPILASAVATSSIVSGSTYEAIYDNGMIIDPSLHSVALGLGNYIYGKFASAEGWSNTIAVDTSCGHAEGYSSNVAAGCGHAEGYSSAVRGFAGHAEGIEAYADASASHAEGIVVYACGEGSHAEGTGGTYSISEAYYGNPIIPGMASPLSITEIKRSGSGIQRITGYVTNEPHNFNVGDYVFIAGYPKDYAQVSSVASDYEFMAGLAFLSPSGFQQHAKVGAQVCPVYGRAIGDYSHIEGGYTAALEDGAHAEGYYTVAHGTNSHAEGQSTIAFGTSSHAEGYNTFADGSYSHAEGYGIIAYDETLGEDVNVQNYASGKGSHVEGVGCGTTGDGAHAEGVLSTADAVGAHAEGGWYELDEGTGNIINSEWGGYAHGNGSHAEGVATTANNTGEHAEGRYNKSHSINSGDSNDTIHSVGIGYKDNEEGDVYLNAFEIMTDGSAYLIGVGNYNGDDIDNASTLQDVINNIGASATTYSFETGDASGQIKVIPSNTTSYNVNVKGLGSAAYVSVDDTVTTTSLNVPNSSAVASAINTAIASAVIYKGDFNANTGDITGGGTMTSVAEKVGDMYIASTAGTFAGTEMEIGDSVIFKKKVAAGTAVTANDVTFVEKTVSVVANNPTLSFGTTTTIGTVEGVDLKVTMPNETITGVTVSGTGNAVTTIGLSGTTITATLGSFVEAPTNSPTTNSMIYYNGYTNVWSSYAFMPTSSPSSNSILVHGLSENLWVDTLINGNGIRTYANTTVSIYAPTTSGANGQYLMSTGSGTPVWTTLSLVDEKVKVSESTTDAGFPLIAVATSSVTSGNTYEAIYDSGIVINPRVGSFANGFNILATGNYSHAEGEGSIASGYASHAGSYYTLANTLQVTAIGRFNSTCSDGDLFVIGNGSQGNERRTVFKVSDASGNIYGGNSVIVTVDGRVNATAGFFQTSDKRQKNIISELPLDKVYDLIDKCQTIIYTLKDDKTNTEQIGMIAQEIQEFFPELITTDKNGMLSLDYSRLTVIIFKVLKDLIKRIDSIEEKLK